MSECESLSAMLAGSESGGDLGLSLCASVSYCTMIGWGGDRHQISDVGH